MPREFLCKIGDIPEGAPKEVRSQRGRKVCVTREGTTVYACQAACPHKGIALAEAVVEGTTLTCLEHLWQWDLRSGEALGMAEETLRVFVVEVDGDSVYIKP